MAVIREAPVVHLGEDDRFDFMRRFAARSAVQLEVVCDRLRHRLAKKYAIPEFCFDAEKEGDDLEAWGEVRSDFIGIAVTVAADYRDIADFAQAYGAPADANYHIHLFWNSKKVSHDEARRMKDVFSDALESPLINLPLKYFV